MMSETSSGPGLFASLLQVIRRFLAQLGPLRVTLVGFSVLSALIAVGPDDPIVYEGWGFIFTVVSPALMPLWLSGLLFDALMSKVVMGDADAEGKARLRLIIRTELLVVAFLVISWLPFFLSIAE